MKRLLVAGGIALAIALGVTTMGVARTHAEAGGNGPNSLTIEADCGSAGTVEVVINLNAGQFSAAHLAGGGSFVPLSFGEVTFVFTDPEGNQESETDPPRTKGQSSHNAGAPINCSFDFTVEFPDGGTFQVSGTVTGFVTPVSG